MKIALLGYGKMGKKIEQAAQQRGHEIVARFDSRRTDLDKVASADVCIEFTHPEAVLKNIEFAASLKKAIVVGTTGWYDKLGDVRTLVREQGIGLLYASNFSVGIYLFLKMVEKAASLINPRTDYDVGLVEYHHSQKKDAPSGTAMQIASILEKQIDRIKPMTIASLRCGSIPGTHTVVFDSPYDTLTLTHEARNREGMAQGAVHAAEWIQRKKGLFSLEDWMDNVGMV